MRRIATLLPLLVAFIGYAATPTEPGASIRGVNAEQRDALVKAIRHNGYRCDSLSDVRTSGFGGWSVSCNKFAETYEVRIDDSGRGVMVRNKNTANAPEPSAQTPLGDVQQLEKLAARVSAELAAMAKCSTLACHLRQVRKACGTLREMDRQAAAARRQIGRTAAQALGKARASCKTAVGRLESGEPLEAASHVKAIGQHLRHATSAIALGT